MNGFPYLGKDELRPNSQHLSEYIVLHLIAPYLDKGRNITTDNFTSCKFAENLKVRKTTIVSTLRRSRREIPPSASTEKNEAIFNQCPKE